MEEKVKVSKKRIEREGGTQIGDKKGRKKEKER